MASSSVTTTSTSTVVEPSILSVQSSVAFGHVGNAAAVFPMQYRGVNVSALHTLQFSFEPLYDCGHAGSRIPDKDIREILGKFSVLCQRQPSLFTHILSGYIGCPEIVAALADFVSEQKARRKETLFACDPVCGDNGKLYVAPEVAERTRSKLIPLADAVFPNAFEAAFLSGVAISGHDSALAAAKALHKMGPTIVVITSYHVVVSSSGGEEGDADGSDAEAQPRRGYCLLSVSSRGNGSSSPKNANAQTEDEAATTTPTLRHRHEVFSFPMISGFFAGTGDILSALILSEIAMKGYRIDCSCENAEQNDKIVFDAVRRSVDIVVAIVQDTAEKAMVVGGQRELRIVPNRKLLDL